MNNDVYFSNYELCMIKLSCMCFQDVLQKRSSGFIKLFGSEAYHKYNCLLTDILHKLDFIGEPDLSGEASADPETT